MATIKKVTVKKAQTGGLAISKKVKPYEKKIVKTKSQANLVNGLGQTIKSVKLTNEPGGGKDFEAMKTQHVKDSTNTMNSRNKDAHFASFRAGKPDTNSSSKKMKSGGTIKRKNNMKSGKAKKAPKVSIPSKENPNYMKESDTPAQRKSPMRPMKQKRLSK